MITRIISLFKSDFNLLWTLLQILHNRLFNLTSQLTHIKGDHFCTTYRLFWDNNIPKNSMWLYVECDKHQSFLIGPLEMSFTPSQPINTKVTRFWHTDIVTAVIKHKNQCIKGTYMTLLGPKGVSCNGSPKEFMGLLTIG